VTRARVLRLVLLVVLIAGLAGVAKFTGVSARFTQAGVRELATHAGAWGVLSLVAAFAVGQLLLIPGTVFFAAAVLAYGRGWGFAVSYLAAMVSITIAFVFLRVVGGQPLAAVKNPRMARLLARLDARPLTTVFVLRLVFWAAPALTIALALSKVRTWHHVVGSAAGLVLPIAGVSLFFGVFFR
jgi:uncharacterized membrane protein YdjX (TVP38/TMEM64 family)